MTFFRFDIGSRARHVGRFVGHVRDELLRAVAEEKDDTGLSQQTLAQRLGLVRSELDGQLSGRKTLTLRDLADLAHALDREIVFELRRSIESPGQNIAPETSTVAQAQVVEFGATARTSSTLATSARNTIVRQSPFWRTQID